MKALLRSLTLWLLGAKSIGPEDLGGGKWGFYRDGQGRLCALKGGKNFDGWYVVNDAQGHPFKS